MPCDKHIGNLIGDFIVYFFGFLWPSGRARGTARTKMVGPTLSIAGAATGCNSLNVLFNITLLTLTL